MNMLIPTVAAMKNEETPLHPVIFRTKGAPFPPYHFLKHMIYILCRREKERDFSSRLLFVRFSPGFIAYETYREMRSRRGFVLQCAALWFLIDLLTQEHCVTLKRGENFLKAKFP